MSTVPSRADAEHDPRVKAVFDDIRATRKSDFINNFWLYLAFDPALLEETWYSVKSVMAVPSALDPLTKELVYIAVSITNSCSYCIHSHTAAARAKGMTDEMYADLLRVVSTAGRTNQLVTGMQVPVDKVFDANAT
ncbi:MAG: carboxymuconolactone decarboxylase family protein [Hyphomicrobiales bacterium]